MNKENADGIKELIENFKREAVEEYKREHGVGWIPCSKRMPEERPSMFAKDVYKRQTQTEMVRKSIPQMLLLRNMRLHKVDQKQVISRIVIGSRKFHRMVKIKTMDL